MSFHKQVLTDLHYNRSWRAPEQRRSHQTCILVGYMGEGTRRSHHFGRQIACGATVRSEANEKLGVMMKAKLLWNSTYIAES